MSQAPTRAGATPEPAGPAATSGGPLWHPETRAFDGARLRRAIVSRGWTVAEFAKVARVHVTSVYNSLHGHPVRDATAIRIFETLEKRTPMLVAMDGS